jgi:hypothetical protein
MEKIPHRVPISHRKGAIFAFSRANMSISREKMPISREMNSTSREFFSAGAVEKPKNRSSRLWRGWEAIDIFT